MVNVPGSSNMKPNSSEAEPNDWDDPNDSCLFINDEGLPMSFILCLKDVQLIRKTSKLIFDRYGDVETLKSHGTYEAVLVDDDSTSWSQRIQWDVFKASYIQDCIDKGKLLDIGDYRLNSTSKLVDGFDYMDIIYRRRFTWQAIPIKFLKEPPTPAPNPSIVDQSIADKLLEEDECDSDDEGCSRRGSSPENDKRTRSLFSYKEKKAMVDYIFSKKQFDQMKGNVFWKTMEKKNICPIRTWQSMKNHFQKTLVYDLKSNYNIPKDDYKNFQRWYSFKPKRR